jgi:hypothetical protein
MTIYKAVTRALLLREFPRMFFFVITRLERKNRD